MWKRGKWNTSVLLSLEIQIVWKQGGGGQGGEIHLAKMKYYTNGNPKPAFFSFSESIDSRVYSANSDYDISTLTIKGHLLQALFHENIWYREASPLPTWPLYSSCKRKICRARKIHISGWSTWAVAEHVPPSPPSIGCYPPAWIGC